MRDGAMLERDDVSSNHHPALAPCLSMIFFRKPVPTFRDHALLRLLTRACDELLDLRKNSRDNLVDAFRRRMNSVALIEP
jgi:hypothetical protein